MSSLDILKNLQDRVSALEQQLGDAVGPDSLQPNILTTNPDGTIGALITGGLTLPETTAAGSQTVPKPNKIAWTNVEGAVVAEIFAAPSTFTDADSGFFAGIDGSDGTRTGLIAQTGQYWLGGAGQFMGAIVAGGIYKLIAAAGQSAIVMNGNGQSRFLQLFAGHKLQLIGGSIDQNGAVEAWGTTGDFTVLHSSTGHYTVTPATAFTAGPIILAMAGGTAASATNQCTASARSVNSFTIACTDAASSAFVDTGADFIAIG